MRKFKLINSTGAEFDLMRLDAFFNSPDGLGFSMSNSYSEIGSSFNISDERSAQKVVSGEMIFRGYQQYKEFSKFISFKPLRLGYKPLDTWAYLDCTVTRLDKGEIGYSTNVLQCPIDFTALGKWYVPREAITSRTNTSTPKKYQYKYSYVYVETVNGEFRIKNEGTEPCPAVLTVFGYASKPKWTLSQGAETLVNNYVPFDIPTGHKLVINSKDNAREIAEYVINGVKYRNLYQHIDFNKKAFPIIPVGDSLLRVSHEAGTPISAVLEIEEQYETV